mmetsp:Transcript_13925/g.30433  ORF Transcript_13925/g.30433 Transcript_13925/m.30433 type:complete len:254 (+) Transcript_13925:116-877(+)
MLSSSKSPCHVDNSPPAPPPPPPPVSPLRRSCCWSAMVRRNGALNRAKYKSVAKDTINNNTTSPRISLARPGNRVKTSKSCSAAHSATGMKSAEIKLPPICCTLSTAVSSPGYVTSTASSALMGCIGPVKNPNRMRAATINLGSFPHSCSVHPSGTTKIMDKPKHSSVTNLYRFVRSTYPPSTMPPITMASSKAAPASDTCHVSVTPPRCKMGSIKAPTTLVMVMEQIKAASALKNPGVETNCRADRTKGGSW